MALRINPITRRVFNSILWIDQIFSQDAEYNVDLNAEILLEGREYDNGDLPRKIRSLLIRF